MVTHFDATLGMGGWLDLAQQGLSPCKKYRASWRSSPKSYQIIELAQHILFIHLFKFEAFPFKELKASIYHFRVIEGTFVLRDFF